MFNQNFQANTHKNNSTQNFNFKIKPFTEMHTDKHPYEREQKTGEPDNKYGFPYDS